MEKQTAVDLVIEQLKEQIRKSAHNELATNRTGDYRIGLSKAIELLEQAKEIEKEQIIQAYYQNGWNDNDNEHNAEQYYNQTYKQD